MQIYEDLAAHPLLNRSHMCSDLIRFCKQSRSLFLHSSRAEACCLFIIAAAGLMSASCMQNQPENKPATNEPANSNSVAAKPPTDSRATVPQAPVTLPLIDAILEDEQVANEAASSLQI